MDSRFVRHRGAEKFQVPITFHSEEQRQYIDNVTVAMAGRQVQRGGTAVATPYDEMMITFSDSSEGAPGSLYHKCGPVQANEGTSGMKAQSAAYAAGLKAYNSHFISFYAKIMPGCTLRDVIDELEAYFMKEMLEIENNPLLAPFTIVIHVCGNEFRNPNAKSKQVWLTDMTDEHKADYARYVRIMRAFPSCMHKGLGSSVCYCPDGSDAKKEEHDRMCSNIANSLCEAPFTMSEVAVNIKVILFTTKAWPRIWRWW